MKFLHKIRPLTGVAIFYGAWPYWLWYLRRNRHRARLVLECEGYILLVRPWIGNSKWGIPGGGCKPGEEPYVAILRETFEEVNISLQANYLQKLGQYELPRSPYAIRYELFYAKLAKRPSMRPVKPEIIAAKWIPVKDFEQYRIKSDALTAIRLATAKTAGLL